MQNEEKRKIFIMNFWYKKNLDKNIYNMIYQNVWYIIALFH